MLTVLREPIERLANAVFQPDPSIFVRHRRLWGMENLRFHHERGGGGGNTGKWQRCTFRPISLSLCSAALSWPPAPGLPLLVLTSHPLRHRLFLARKRSLISSLSVLHCHAHLCTSSGSVLYGFPPLNRGAQGYVNYITLLVQRKLGSLA